MAIYHLTCKIINRKSGRSSVGSAAYRAAEKIKNENDNLVHDYTKKSGVIYSEILTPDNVPAWAKDRATLWNEVEKVERRKDAQTSREIEVALPIELNTDEQKQVLKNYINENFVQKGMIADLSIHNKKDGNPHAHVMLTMRDVNEDGFKNKNRDWNGNDKVSEWRKNWADTLNKIFKEKGIDERVDHRSYEDQGVEKLPTQHLGQAHALEKKGIETERGNYNRNVKKINNELEKIENKINNLESSKKELEQKREEEIKNTLVQKEKQKSKEQEKELNGLLNNIKTNSTKISKEQQKIYYPEVSSIEIPKSQEEPQETRYATIVIKDKLNNEEQERLNNKNKTNIEANQPLQPIETLLNQEEQQRLIKSTKVYDEQQKPPQEQLKQEEQDRLKGKNKLQTKELQLNNEEHERLSNRRKPNDEHLKQAGQENLNKEENERLNNKGTIHNVNNEHDINNIHKEPIQSKQENLNQDEQERLNNKHKSRNERNTR